MPESPFQTCAFFFGTSIIFFSYLCCCRSSSTPHPRKAPPRLSVVFFFCFLFGPSWNRNFDTLLPIPALLCLELRAGWSYLSGFSFVFFFSPPEPSPSTMIPISPRVFLCQPSKYGTPFARSSTTTRPVLLSAPPFPLSFSVPLGSCHGVNLSDQPFPSLGLAYRYIPPLPARLLIFFPPPRTRHVVSPLRFSARSHRLLVFFLPQQRPPLKTLRFRQNPGKGPPSYPQLKVLPGTGLFLLSESQFYVSKKNKARRLAYEPTIDPYTEQHAPLFFLPMQLAQPRCRCSCKKPKAEFSDFFVLTVRPWAVTFIYSDS